MRASGRMKTPCVAKTMANQLLFGPYIQNFDFYLVLHVEQFVTNQEI